MKVYRYISEKPMDFVCNGIPSHLHYGQIVKDRLIDYMTSNHPEKVAYVGENESIPAPILTTPKSTYERQDSQTDIIENIDMRAMGEVFLSDVGSTPALKLPEGETLVNPNDELAKAYEELSKNVAPKKKRGRPRKNPKPDDGLKVEESLGYEEELKKFAKRKKVDVSKLKSYFDVNSLFREELEDVCEALKIDPNLSKSARVKLICERLDIKYKR
jgi:hypothetical protein